MSTMSKCCTATQVVTGVLVAAGVAALVWVALSRRHAEEVDPLTEADRRIDALEDSLRRLHDSFGQAVGV